MRDVSLPTPVATITRQLRDALHGGPAAAPLPLLHPGVPAPGTAVVVRTSGSTGVPREVALGPAALRASTSATHQRLGGPGRWVLTLPATHIAGIQVLVRSLLAADDGVPTPLIAAEPGQHFTPAGLAALLGPAFGDGTPVYVSLVPTQVHRVLQAADDGAPEALDALARCAAVLLGGAATPPALLARATAAGVSVVRTYGMSETAGGCVYDGLPLSGVRVRVRGTNGGASGGAGSGDDDGLKGGLTGVVELGGPVLATGYVGDPAATSAAFVTDGGERWFRTSDLGTLATDGSLSVLGRADDVVVTGGVNVAPAPVEAVLTELLPELLGAATVEPCVVGVPDAEWGQALVAVVAVPDGHRAPGRTADNRALVAVDAVLLAEVKAAVAARLGGPSAPRRIYLTGTLPLRGPGKVDRRAVAEAVAAATP